MPTTALALAHPVPPPAVPERLASAWQGLLDGDSPERELAPADWDLWLAAVLGQATGWVSPAALLLAWTDWASHLALSPSKRDELALKFGKKWARWLWYTAQAHGPAHPPWTIDPLPQDRRFTDPAWQQWPFDLIAQGFLLQQQWWHCATTGVRGMSSHHEHVVTFVARQLLDMLAPSNFVLTNPVVLQETARRGGANLLAGLARAAEDALRLATGQPAPDRPHLILGQDLAVTPGTVVYRNRLIELIQYAPSTAQTHAHPVLFVPAWIMKYYILDLTPEDSLVRYLVAQGHTVFMISWRNPEAADRDLSLEDYRELGIMAALAHIDTACARQPVQAVGYCLGGTLLSIAAAAMARDGDHRLASITLLAAQVEFSEPGELSLFIDDSEVSYLEAAMWYQGYLDTHQMAGAFQLLRSNDLIWSRRLNAYLLDQPEPVTALSAWNADATRMPYRMHTDYLRHLFLNNDLAGGRYVAGGQPVALSDIHAPMFAVGTVTDHVAPWRSVYKLNLMADTDVTFLLTSGGHNAGVVSPPGRAGRSYQIATRPADSPYIDPDRWAAGTPRHSGSWWPAWERWLASHAGAWQPPPASGPALAPAPGTYVRQS